MPQRASSLPLDRLAPQVAGLSARGDPDYERARTEAIWNKRLDSAHSPDAIIRCANARQVGAAIRFAATHGLQMALRGSGHSYIAAPLRDGGLLLDCGGMDDIAIDPENRSARVGPGTRGGDMIEALAGHGLAFPIGHCSTVALGGYLLSGGLGWNQGAWGPACNHVTAIEAVTAEGDIVHASETEHPDLFWAARGAGCGFFAAVTAYHLTLHPMPLAAWLWTASFPAASAPALRLWLNAATRAAHPAAEIMCLIGPDPHDGRATITVRAVAMADNAAEAREHVASFRSPPKGIEPISGPSEQGLSFAELTNLSHMPDGKRVAADQLWSDHPPGDLVVAVHHLIDRPHAPSTINLVSPGGNGRIPAMPDEAAGALSVGGGLSAGIYAMWDDPAQDDLHCAWVRAVDAALAPFAAGRYVGEADLGAASGRVAECFSAPALARLEAIRRRYDPEGRFFTFPG